MLGFLTVRTQSQIKVQQTLVDSLKKGTHKGSKKTKQNSKGKNTEEQKSENPIRYQVHGTRKMQHTGVASHRQTITIRQGTTERLNLYRRGNRDKTQVKQTRGINKTQEKQIRPTTRVMIGNRWGRRRTGKQQRAGEGGVSGQWQNAHGLTTQTQQAHDEINKRGNTWHNTTHTAITIKNVS